MDDNYFKNKKEINFDLNNSSICRNDNYVNILTDYLRNFTVSYQNDDLIQLNTCYVDLSSFLKTNVIFNDIDYYKLFDRLGFLSNFIDAISSENIPKIVYTFDIILILISNNISFGSFFYSSLVFFTEKIVLINEKFKDIFDVKKLCCLFDNIIEEAISDPHIYIVSIHKLFDNNIVRTENYVNIMKVVSVSYNLISKDLIECIFNLSFTRIKISEETRLCFELLSVLFEKYPSYSESVDFSFLSYFDMFISVYFKNCFIRMLIPIFNGLLSVSNVFANKILNNIPMLNLFNGKINSETICLYRQLFDIVSKTFVFDILCDNGFLSEILVACSTQCSFEEQCLGIETLLHISLNSNGSITLSISRSDIFKYLINIISEENEFYAALRLLDLLVKTMVVSNNPRKSQINYIAKKFSDIYESNLPLCSNNDVIHMYTSIKTSLDGLDTKLM